MIYDYRDRENWTGGVDDWEARFDHNDIVIAEDPQERLGEGTLVVSRINFNDGEHVHQLGLFWTAWGANRFAHAFEDRKTEVPAYDEVGKLYYGWTQFRQDVEALAEEIQGSDVDFDIVVGIARGGLPGATILSHQLGVDLETIKATSYDGQEQLDNLEVGGVNLPHESDALIFDDVVDTGRTMGRISEQVQLSTSGSVRTAAIHIKPGRDFDPDFFRTETDEWIVYPWEATN